MHSWEPSPSLNRAVDEFLGDDAGALIALAERVERLDAFTRDADTIEVVPLPMDDAQARKWRAIAEASGESWAFVASGTGGNVMALDEPTDIAQVEPHAGVIYPAIHTRLAAWWLFHAWRAVDLLHDSIENLRAWRLNSGAVSARALIETTGCLVHEARKLHEAWASCKQGSADGPFDRVNHVQSTMGTVLTQAAFGSRAKVSGGHVPATNVLTYVDKLAKAAGDARFADWYDWLSDAAHPAWGARIAMGSDPLVHESRAVLLRYYARAPLVTVGAGGRKGFEYPVAQRIADATMACGAVLEALLDSTLHLVDDFGLTTAAATYTRRTYWRNFSPVRGSRACPCGRGKWPACGHRWGQPAPVLRIPSTNLP